MNESLTAEIFISLDTVVVEKLDNGLFTIIGIPPDWFMRFQPSTATDQNCLRLEQFPFLENFLVDAECFWIDNKKAQLKSGLWSEVDTFGNEYHLEASALRLRSRKILLISLVEIAYEEKQLLLQQARENSLNYYRFSQEIQKKETLLYCIAHDLAGQIMGSKFCFELLDLQEMAPKGKEYVEIGKKQAKNQEVLIREMLDIFSAKVESREAFTPDYNQAPDVLTSAREVVDTLFPSSLLNKVNLLLSSDIDLLADWRVVGEKLGLNRVIYNLVENALRHSPPNSSVTIGLQQYLNFTIVMVDDQGPGVDQDISKTLFKKFSQGKDQAGRVGIGLYFCRSTIEHWGGTIGYLNIRSGGSRFWFRLPRFSTY